MQFALVATHGALPPELYWKSKLPTTPMPKAITDLLHPAGKYIYIIVSKQTLINYKQTI